MLNTASVVVTLSAVAIVVAVAAGLLVQNHGEESGAGEPGGVGPATPIVETNQGPPATSQPRTIELFEATWPTRNVRAFYTVHGIKPVPLFTRWYCCPGDRKGDQFLFDEQLFRTRLYSPNRPAQRCGCQTDRVAGIPPGWSSWVVLDLERPIWTALKFCDSDERKRAKSLKVFMQVINAIRLARPGVRLALYGLPLNDDGPCVEIERRILAKVDGSVTPLFQSTRRRNQRAFHERWLRRHLEYKRSRPGFKVIPLIWKKWQNKKWPTEAKPINQARLSEAAARDHIQWLLDYDVDGTRVDGVVIFCNLETRHERTDLEFARILVEEVAKRTKPPDDPG